jgi:hypothetical protein
MLCCIFVDVLRSAFRVSWSTFRIQRSVFHWLVDLLIGKLVNRSVY